MSITRQPRIHYWLLVCSCYLLPLYTHSSPLLRTDPQYEREKLQPNNVNCEHDSIAELIKTSPVILKALGARIFTNSDLKWFESSLSAQSGGNNFLKSASEAMKTTSDTPIESDGASVSGAGVDSTLITLTPETIYKGASLLKMTSTVANAARNTESMYQFEGQLNATLRPLSCFDGNVLKMLPTELIAFGKLVSVQQQQQKQQMQPQQQHGTEMLRISINGLHRWSAQFENHIWKHLGWDDWSDFTLCSVTCGKGVQQRFRRCLLDNPMMMMSLNMNMNLNVVDDDDGGSDGDVDDDADNEEAYERNLVVDDGYADEDEIILVDENQQEHSNERLNVVSHTTTENSNTGNIKNSVTNDCNEEQSKSKSSAENEEADKKNTMRRKSSSRKTPSTASMSSAATTTTTATKLTADVIQQRHHLQKQWSKYSTDFKEQTSVIFADDAADDSDIEVMRNFKGHLNAEELSTAATKAAATAKAAETESAGSASDSKESITGSSLYRSDSNKHKQHGKKKKSAKNFSTMFCEGYNIEQRDCNTFECSDDLSDLLKFYKKFLTTDEVGLISSSIAPATVNNSKNVSSITTTAKTSAATTYISAAPAFLSTTAPSVAVPSSTPANMGYVRSWRNNLNFTLMITLRVKNDTKTTATIFSIRNSTHNLYLEPSTEGLRLYLERDNQTEMLPVKFKLYDNRWHQVAISIQNGDFISIFVDCSWTNSFVVSKRLFSLPLDADVEIGRGFNGELQQLLVLPDNQERHQCSNVRTSINEVKRYIIDTFIDDYGN